MISFGLCRQRRGNGVGCPGNRREGEKSAGEAFAGADSGAERPPRPDWRFEATAYRVR